MVRLVLIDEVHLRLLVPSGLSDKDKNTIYRIVNRSRFDTSLKRAISAVCRQFPELARVRVRLAR